MAKTFDDKKIIYTMDRVSRSYGTKVVLKDISISYFYGAKIMTLFYMCKKMIRKVQVFNIY